MAIADVIRRGYGGQIRQVVTRGFWNSALPPVLVEQLPDITVKVNSGVYTYPLAPYFAGETSFSSSTLATGFTLNTSTGVLTVDSGAEVAGTYGPYTISGINSSGTTAGNAIHIKLSNSKVSADARDYFD